MSVAPVTVAVKVCALPKTSEMAAGVMVTVMDEGDGAGAGGGTTAAFVPPVLPAQPSVKAAEEKRIRSGSAAKDDWAAL